MSEGEAGRPEGSALGSTRTDKATLHFATNAVLFLVQGIGQFFVRSLMISRLGSEMTGLQAVFGQIMAYLGLAEGGLGIALVAHLYAPLARRDFDSIRSMLAGARRWYRGVGLVVLGGAFASSPLLKTLITETTIDRGYIAACFILFALGTVVDYFTVTPRLLLEADQQGYVTNWVSLVLRTVDLALTIAMLLCGLDLAVVLVKNIVINAAVNLTLGVIARKRYPWLAEKPAARSYGFTKEIKYLIVQSLASVVVYNTSYIFLSHYLDLNEVTRYSNYMIVVNFMSNVATIFARAASSGLGDLIARGDSQAALRIQEELGAFLAFFASVTSVLFVSQSSSFITLWVGPGFMMSDGKVAVVALLYYYSVARTYVITTLNSAGRFREVTLSPVIESAVNLAISFALVPHVGLMGILIANAAGHLASNFAFYPTICYRSVFKTSPSVFYRKFFLRLAPVGLLIAAFLALGEGREIFRPRYANLYAWIAGSALRAVMAILAFGGAYMAASKDFRSLCARVVGFIRSKLERNNVRAD